MSRVEKVVERKHDRYNCAQAIACTYCDYVGIDEETMYHLTQGFGAGNGTMDGTCGAISGAEVILGLLNKNSGETMRDSRRIMNEFKNNNESVLCKDLKGIETGKPLRSCEDCVRDVVKMLEDIINEKPL
ncbi:C_GCAxxG_C_C family probable redox protein [Peptoniphilus asaccharolyticus DSM 20463]|uniref:C_GCAxxG_C_C family probable redox protein n=1 Tax=Peptoniphilus asaccharolyticus DSM 20463 TaxID=573058 RepID=A0A1W1VEM8_PEPAS|nr:C-GCAxxG-C-C family protein [Peptoniphilus asaccharolyticus]SMB91673.1 C_GCAxxG_C_C family probable redox protein [Peptoniphilus asaccharolyticus DSM 20463]